MVMLMRYFVLVLMCAAMFNLAGCRSVVPTPTMPLSEKRVSLPSYQLHNIGPQRIVESRAIHFVDLDQDGFLDLLVGGRKSIDGFHVEWGDGAGHWRIQNGPETSMQPRDFAVGDVNGNGRLDVLIGGEGDQKGLQIWELDGQKKAWTLLSSPVLAGLFHAVSLVDINHDGWLDIIAARFDNEKDGGIYVLLNDAKGGWFEKAGPMVSGFFTDIAVADINADGHVDIVASRRGGLGAKNSSDDVWRQSGGVQVWYGDGSARWEPKALPAYADAESVTLADVNGDGHLDIIAGLYQQGIVMWMADDDRWMRKTVASSGTWGQVKVGDWDGDGSRELFATSSDGKGLGVWQWHFGSFSKKIHLLPDYGIYYGLDLGDVWNDGHLAIAAVRADGGAEVWSGKRAVLEVAKSFQGKKNGSRLTLFFESGKAALKVSELDALQAWQSKLGDLSGLHFEIEGRADIRPIHSEIYPNNRALSQARAESVVGWLHHQGVPLEAATIHVLGATDPLKRGQDPLALQENRSVFLQAYRMDQVRLPSVKPEKKKGDLFHVSQNHVFKTIDGIAEYRIGVGDKLSLTFWQGGKSTEYKVTVQVDGTVSLPYQSALKVASLTPREVDQNVTEILKRFERHPRVDVLVIQALSKKASIFGQVQDLTRQPTGPGRYFLRGKETLVNFLSRVGGPAKDADLTKVQMLRSGKTVVLNLDKAIKQGDWEENAILDDGDTIFIPSLAQSKRRVYVLGAVSKPGIVEFVGDIHFLEAISKSGGTSKDAYLRDIRVLRANRDAPLILPVNFQRFMEQGDLSQNVSLQDKDVILVPTRPIANWNTLINAMTPTLSLLAQPAYVVQSFQVLSNFLKTGKAY